MDSSPAYDRIGVGYARHRRPDPRIGARILDALGDARTVVNVGAGTGSYEPTDRPVVAVDPSATMLAQRAAGSAPAVQGVAERLPFPDGAFDAAMGVLTVHHWSDVARGLRELRRVAPRQVLLTFDAAAQGALWFGREYLPESLDLDGQAPTVTDIVDGLGGGRVVTVPVPHDCSDGSSARTGGDRRRTSTPRCAHRSRRSRWWRPKRSRSRCSACARTWDPARGTGGSVTCSISTSSTSGTGSS